ncbi:hypothetical protein D3C72_2079970 [compost metagenome]
MDIGCVQAALRLLVNRNSLRFQILNRPVGTASIHCVNLIKGLARQLRHVYLAAIEFIPDDKTQGYLHAHAPDAACPATAARASATATSEFICSQRPQRPALTTPNPRAQSAIVATACGFSSVFTG